MTKTKTNEFLAILGAAIGLLIALEIVLPDPRDFTIPPTQTPRGAKDKDKPIWDKPATEIPRQDPQGHETKQTLDLQDDEGPKEVTLDVEYSYTPSNAALNISPVELESATSGGEDHLDKLSTEQTEDLEHEIAEEERSYVR